MSYESRFNHTQPNRRYAYAHIWESTGKVHFAYDRVKFYVNRKGNQFYEFDVNESRGRFTRHKLCVHANPKHPPTLMVWEAWEKGRWCITSYWVEPLKSSLLLNVKQFWEGTGPFVDESIPKFYRK